MKSRDLILVASVAAFTFAGAVLFELEPAIGEGEPADPAPPAQPTLDLNGAQVTLEAPPALQAPGPCPAPTLHLANPTGAPVDASPVVSVMVTPPTSPFSRMMPMPASKWQDRCPTITLAPGETRTLAVTPELELAAGESYFFVVSAPAEEGGEAPRAIRNEPVTVPATAQAAAPAPDASPAS